MHLTEGHEGHARWKEPGRSYRSICSYRKLPPPACPGTICITLENFTQSTFLHFLGAPSSFLLLVAMPGAPGIASCS